MAQKQSTDCARFGDAKAEARGVNGIDLLFDVIFHRHQEHRLAEPSRFAEGFKACGTSDVFAFSHHAEEFFAVEPMKLDSGEGQRAAGAKEGTPAFLFLKPTSMLGGC